MPRGDGSFRVNLTGPGDAQISGYTFFLDVSVMVFLEEISI